MSRFSEMCSFDFVHTSLCCMRSLLSSLSTERSGFSEFEKSQVLPRNEGKVRLWSFRPEDVPLKSREQAEEHAITIGCLIIASLAPPLPYPLKSRTWERNNKEKKKKKPTPQCTQPGQSVWDGGSRGMQLQNLREPGPRHCCSCGLRAHCPGGLDPC